MNCHGPWLDAASAGNLLLARPARPAGAFPKPSSRIFLQLLAPEVIQVRSKDLLSSSGPESFVRMEIHFGIHQDLWQDAWIAATSAVRARKRQIDLNVQQRVERLISDHGPKTEKALTLRVYGTMIKGFCVINNDRAKLLHSDCERVVLRFAAQPYSERLKLPTAKRQRVEAVTLDLDLARVKEAEQFDWTQAPMAGALLSLEHLPEPEASGWAMAAVPTLEVEGMRPEPEVFPEALPAGDVAPMDLPDTVPEVVALVEPKREKRKNRRQLPPGHVIGFDIQMQLRELPECEDVSLKGLFKNTHNNRNKQGYGALRDP